MTEEIKKYAIKSILSSLPSYKDGIKPYSSSLTNNGYDLLEWVMEDIDLRSALSNKHSILSNAKYFFKKPLSKKDEKKLKEARFNKWLRDSFWQEVVYFNSFTEISKLKNTSRYSLNLIKTDEVEIINKPNGDVVGYLQLPTNQDVNEMIINLPVDKIVHISYDNLDTGVWGKSNLTTAITYIKKKRIIEHWLNWLFESNQFRTMVKFPTNMSEDDIKDYIEALKSGMMSVNNFLLVQGDETEIALLRKLDDLETAIKLMDYYSAKVFTLLQVPPIQLGDPNASDRGSSEYQVRYAYYTHINSLLKIKADEINSELLPKLDIDNEIVFSVIDSRSEEEILNNAIKLKSVGMDTKKLNEWLLEKGLNIGEDSLKDFEDGSQVKLDKNSDQHPSRVKTEMDFAGGSRQTN